VAGEDMLVPHGDGGANIRPHKRPEGERTFRSDRIAIMMHGATYPGTAFDLPLAGKSWMDYLAAWGFDVYALDLPGYGWSTRPAIMEAAADENPPYMQTAEATKAVGAVVDYVLNRRGVDKVNLIGWSWGTIISASYTTEMRLSGSFSMRLCGCAPRRPSCRLRASSGPTALSLATSELENSIERLVAV
jgi:pimeloyl-ACP methyl ester carboxylesterase